MPQAITPSQPHLEEAFAHQHKPDWPVHTWADLSRAARLYGLVTGSAHRLANGHQLLTTELDVCSPITNPTPASSSRRTDAEMRQAVGRALRCGTCGGYSRVCMACKGSGRATVSEIYPARRREDTGVDFKSRAAGEKDEA